MGCSSGDLATGIKVKKNAGGELLERDEDELMLLCDERVIEDEEENQYGVLETAFVDNSSSSSASSSRDEVNLLSSRVGEEISEQEELNRLAENLEKNQVKQNIICYNTENHINSSSNKEDAALQKKEQYALRRNPKRSQRFIDEEFSLEISAGSAPSGPKSSSSWRGASIFNEKARACTECGKEFSSWKALFGHMRCHPEREWRGIQKPVSIHQLAAKSSMRRSSSSKAGKSRPHAAQTTAASLEQFGDRGPSFFKIIASDDESDTESIEAAYMSGGGFFNSNGTVTATTTTIATATSPAAAAAAAAAGKITGKRSKRQRTTVFLQQPEPAIAAASGDMKEERDMANCLVMLACAGQKSTSSGSSQGAGEGDGSSSSGTIDMNLEAGQEMNNGGGGGGDETLEQKTTMVRGGTGDGTNNGSSSFTMLESGGTSTAGTSSRNLLVDETSGLFTASGELLEQMMKYECTTCKRIFKSHQALGGHRASHKKVKGCFARTNVVVGSELVVQQPDEVVDLVMEDELLLRSDEQLDFHQHEHQHQHHHYGHIVPVLASSPLAAAAAAVTAGHHHQHHRGTQLDFSSFKDELGSSSIGFSSSFGSRKLQQQQQQQLMRAHECSICHRVFTSGQALGGHKRCHWGGTVERTVVESSLEKPVATAGESSSSSKLVASVVPEPAAATGDLLGQKEELLDLNLTVAAAAAPGNHHQACQRQEEQQAGQVAEDACEEVEVEILAGGFGCELQGKISRKQETDAGSSCVFKQMPRLVPAYALAKRRQEAATSAAATSPAAHARKTVSLNGYHHHLRDIQATVTTTTTSNTTGATTTTTTPTLI